MDLQRKWKVAVGAAMMLIVGACSPRSSPPGALTEHDFAADPALRMQLHQVAVTFLEPRGDGGGPGDTGDPDSDVIPLHVTETRSFGLALSPRDSTIARVRLLRKPGDEVLFDLSERNPVGAVTLTPGDYDLVVFSRFTPADAGGAPHRTVFLAPRRAEGTARARTAGVVKPEALRAGVHSSADGLACSLAISTSVQNCGDVFSEDDNREWCGTICPTPASGEVPLCCYQGLANAINACETTFTDNTNVNTCEHACYQSIDPVLGLSESQALSCAASIPVVTQLLSTNQCIACELTGAGLAGANLSHANLAYAFLDGAHLEGADLSGANLMLAGLAGANLAGANLASTQMVGADLRGAITDGAYLCSTSWPDGSTRNDSCGSSPPGQGAACTAQPNCHGFGDASNGFRCETVCHYGVGNRSCCVSGLINVIDACAGTFSDPGHVWRCENECQASDDGTWGLTAGHARNCALNVANEINTWNGADPGPGWTPGCDDDPASSTFLAISNPALEIPFTLDGPDPYGLWNWVQTTLTPYAYGNPAASGNLFNPMIWPTSHWEYYYGGETTGTDPFNNGTYYFGSRAPGCQRSYMTANAFTPSWDLVAYAKVTRTLEFGFSTSWWDRTPLHDSLQRSPPEVYRDGGFDDLSSLTGLAGDELASAILATYQAVGDFALLGALNTHTGNSSLYLLCADASSCSFSNVPYGMRYPMALFLGRVGNLTTYMAGTSIVDTFELHIGLDPPYGSPLLFTYFVGTVRVAFPIEAAAP